MFSLLMQDSVEARVRCYFSLLDFGYGWLSNSAFADMLSALALIPSTTQIDVSSLKYIVEGLVVHFWVAFTKEVSLLCVMGTSAGCRVLHIEGHVGSHLIHILPT
jgi:hypothetical protein